MQEVTGSGQQGNAEIERALPDILSTSTFERSERMRAFLSYVVAEAVARRGDLIRAKTIAQDVYGRDPSREDYSENIVRVDARRLRRMLDDYYNNEGTDVALRIRMETGSYTPSFDLHVPGEASTAEHEEASWSGWLLPRRNTAIVGGLVVIAIVAALFQGLRSDVRTDPVSSAARSALFDRSGAVLQAENLCAQGRGLLFPIADLRQQTIATELFRRAMELAPDYACGYAGVAHSLATLTLLASDETVRAARLSEAQQAAERAQAIAPDDGWVVSGLAWSAVAGGDLDRAAELSRRSEQLSPRDGNVLDFHGVVSILAGNYDEARRATDPTRERSTFGLGHAHRNVYGVASFHDGDYAAAIQAWQDAVRLGEPVSALTLVYLAVAHQAKGDRENAAEYARDLMSSWPDFPASKVIQNLYFDEQVTRELLTLLEAAGWSPS